MFKLGDEVRVEKLLTIGIITKITEILLDSGKVLRLYYLNRDDHSFDVSKLSLLVDPLEAE